MLRILKMNEITRREFLKKSGRVALGVGAGFVFGANLLNSSGCVSLEKSLKDYKDITKKWDPVYGPSLSYFSRYGGRCDFKGHISGGARSPGVDYDIPNGTPIVPAASAFLHKKPPYRDRGGFFIVLRHIVPGYKTGYAHLTNCNIVDKRYYHGKSEIQRLIKRNEIFTLSGNTGEGPREFGGMQQYHLHFDLNYWGHYAGKGKYIDPEEHGIDGGKPVFWDGKTDLDIKASQRLTALNKTLENFEGELGTWNLEDKDLQELNGNLLEYHKLMGDAKGTEVLDSKHFHDLRELLKKKTLEEKTHIPGTEPYSLMLKVLGYSMDEKQEIILTLPFIAPSLVGLYKEPVYEDGEFLPWRGYRGIGL